MRLTKMIYVCSPYTYKTKDLVLKASVQTTRAFEVSRAIGKMQDIYTYAFIGPITQSHVTAKYMKLKPGAFKAWKVRDLTYISRCDEIWVLPLGGWQESVGVQEEISFAIQNDIPVKMINRENFKVKLMRVE